METVYVCLAVVGAYLLGSVSAAIVTCKVMHLPDPRSVGSLNPGATNVYQVAGKKPAVITLVGDLLKGFIPVLIVKLLGGDVELMALVGMGSFLGHLYPVFFSFEGGKGVATAFGVVIALNVYVATALLLTWLGVFYLSKLSSLSALVSALFLPLYFYLITQDMNLVLMSGLMSMLLTWRHRSNIVKIIDGTED